MGYIGCIQRRFGLNIGVQRMRRFQRKENNSVVIIRRCTGMPIGRGRGKITADNPMSLSIHFSLEI